MISLIKFHQIDIIEKDFLFSQREMIAHQFQIDDDTIFPEDTWPNFHENMDLIPDLSKKRA